MGQVFSFTAEELSLKDDDERLRGEWLRNVETGEETWHPDGFKCGGCNWECSRLYALAKSREEAKASIEAGEIGMCGECFAEFLSEENINCG